MRLGPFRVPFSVSKGIQIGHEIPRPEDHVSASATYWNRVEKRAVTNRMGLDWTGLDFGPAGNLKF